MSGANTATQTQQQQQTNNPWAPATPSLNTALGGANSAYNASSAAAANVPTQSVASFSPDQLAAFKAMVAFANGNGSLPGTLTGTGTTQLGAGTGAATGALSSLINGASTDPTASNVSDAMAYANAQSPFISQEVQNAMLGGEQTARDVTLPGITQNAAATGNINSSRVGGPDGGIAAGLVERGLAEQGASLYGTLEGNAYNTGLTTAEQQREANLGALSGAAGTGINLANSGASTISGGLGAGSGLLDLSATGGTGETAATQAQIDNILAQYGLNVSAPFAPVDQFSQVVDPIAGLGGSSTGSSTSTSTPSMLQTIGGLLTGVGNLGFGLYGNSGLLGGASK